MKFKELKENTVDKLHKLLKGEREKVRATRFSINSRQEKNVRKLRDSKKTISQILTILNSRQGQEVEDNKKVEEDKK